MSASVASVGDETAASAESGAQSANPAVSAEEKAEEKRRKQAFKKESAITAAKELAEKKRLDDIIQRQLILEALEINQTWNIVFGNIKPKKKKEIHRVKNITLRNIWMESCYIYNELKNFKPDEIFHPVEKYCLQWQPPNLAFKLIVPLDNPVVVERTILRISQIVKRNKILFYFVPYDPSIGLFAPRVHPASLVSYRSKVTVLKKLCEFYVASKISLAEFNTIMACGYDIWRVTLFNMLPEDEQEYHKYLNVTPEAVIDKQSIDRKYLNELITIQEYEDLKFPERKRKKDEEKKSYPLPYTYSNCVICHREDVAIIKCQNCDNHACPSCIHREFLDPETRSGCFLNMHRRFCLRLGKLPEIIPEIVQEPFYLRELRDTGLFVYLYGLPVCINTTYSLPYPPYLPLYSAVGRIKALETLLPTANEIELVDEDGHTIEEEDEDENEEARLAREKAERLKLENPEELQMVQVYIDVEMKKKEKYKKNILKCQALIEEGGHSDMYIARQERLKHEEIDKFKKIERILQRESKKLIELDLQGEFVKKAKNDLDIIQKDIDLLRVLDSIEVYSEQYDQMMIESNEHMGIVVASGKSDTDDEDES